jgi:hypothetical protein
MATPSSPKGEYVEFVDDCLCDGPVETWLQHVVDAMKAGLAAEFKRWGSRGAWGPWCTL